MADVEFGIYVLGHRLRLAEAVLDVAARAEDLGFDSLWAGERLFYSGHQPDAPIDWNPLTVLSFVAARTSRIRLGTSTLILPYHQPLLLAKEIATLDQLSGGRVIVGVGVGGDYPWVRDEFAALGLPFEERGAIADEYIAALKELWTSEQPRFTGRFCSFGPLTFAPPPLQKPHPPIWVAGSTERAMRRAVDLADGWQPELDIPQMEAAAPKFFALAKEKARNPVLAVGRRLEIRDADAGPARTPLQGSAKEVAADVRHYVQLGVNHFVLWAPGDAAHVLDQMRLFAREVRPALA